MSSRERVVESSREILTIIMLTPTRLIGLGYGFGVEQFDTNGFKENGLVHDRKEPLKTYESHGETKEENIYKCTYCGNWKADDSVTKCVYCGNLSFEKTNAETEKMMNNNIM